MIEEYTTSLFKMYCDSCHKEIAYCEFLSFEEGEKLVYSPILCEFCGQKHNKDIADDVFRLKKMEQLLTNLYPKMMMFGPSNIYLLESEMKKLNIDWKFK